MATGKNRSFIIRMPPGYDGKKPFPILMSFHGAGGNGASFETGAFAAVSRMATDRAIRIYPNGLDNGWSRDEPDDVLFIDALVEWLKTRVCYDTARVYAAGQSSGAYFSHRLACDRGSLIRAIATNSGGQRRERALADCKSPVAAWISAGAADNPGHVMGAVQARDMWATRNGCGMSAMAVPPSPCMARAGCMPGYPVVHCQHGGGHPIPGYGAAGIVGFLFDSKF
jgi:poly(3-hydroxybutyrate) depolymerase